MYIICTKRKHIHLITPNIIERDREGERVCVIQTVEGNTRNHKKENIKRKINENCKTNNNNNKRKQRVYK